MSPSSDGFPPSRERRAARFEFFDSRQLGDSLWIKSFIRCPRESAKNRKFRDLAAYTDFAVQFRSEGFLLDMEAPLDRVFVITRVEELFVHATGKIDELNK